MQENNTKAVGFIFLIFSDVSMNLSRHNGTDTPVNKRKSLVIETFWGFKTREVGIFSNLMI